MHPLNTWPLQDRQSITGVLTDIDDTLTTGGVITPDALAALGALKTAGLEVIAITGRPAGWCEAFVPVWPVHAVVAENGGVMLQFMPAEGLQPSNLLGGQLSKKYQQDDATRAIHFTALQRVAQRVLREVPGATLARDSAGRETDIAIDHSEFSQLSPEKIAQTVRIMQSEGLNATVSSIHINGWLGAHDKLQGARWAVQTLWGRDLDAERAQWVYVGDSPNDALMFEAFDNSVGVANIRHFETQLSPPPRYITPSERGAGFAEVVAALREAGRLNWP